MKVEYADPSYAMDGVKVYECDNIYRDFNDNCTEFVLVLEKGGTEVKRLSLKGLLSIKDSD